MDLLLDVPSRQQSRCCAISKQGFCVTAAIQIGIFAFIAGGTSSDAILFLLLWGGWAVWRWAQRVRGGWAARAAQREAATAHSLSAATFMQAAGDSTKQVGEVITNFPSL